jgi:hypothetical protein
VGAGEEYLDGSGAAAPFATPELQALQSASQAVSSMAAQQVLLLQLTLPILRSSCLWHALRLLSLALKCGAPLVVQGWSGSISGSAGSGSKAAAPALPSGRSMGRLLPWAGGSPERPGAGRAFDLEVEVQREGGGGVFPAQPCPLHDLVTLALHAEVGCPLLSAALCMIWSPCMPCMGDKRYRQLLFLRGACWAGGQTLRR